MSGIFRGLLRARQAVAPRASIMVRQRANNISSKPPKDIIGAAETVFVLAVMSVAILGPSGWILAHLRDYQKRD